MLLKLEESRPSLRSLWLQAFSLNTVFLAVSCLDRFLSKESCGRGDFKLAAVTCLFLAAKVEEKRPLRMFEVVELCGDFQKAKIMHMEYEVLFTLKWSLQPPQPVDVACTLIASCLDRELRSTTAQKSSLYLAEALFSTKFLRFCARTQALAAVVVALTDQFCSSTCVLSSAFVIKNRTIDAFFHSAVEACNWSGTSQSVGECTSELTALFRDEMPDPPAPPPAKSPATFSPVDASRSINIERI